MTDRTHPGSGSATGGIVEQLQARIADLEAQLEAICAGGVSGPLLGRAAEHFRDATKMIHWYMVNKDGMATLCADQADAEAAPALTQGAAIAAGAVYAELPDDVIDYVKGSYAFLQSTAPDGYAEEVFSLPPSATRNQRSLQDALQSDKRGWHPAAARQDSGDGKRSGPDAGVSASHGQAPAETGEVRRAELVPGVMHCAKCKFQLNRVTLCVSDGNAYAGNNKTEPCPNGCGPLWPVTWEQEAKNCWKALEEMHERLMAAAAPQPSPTAQAASSAVLKAIREANMQLVRTGDNAFMLVPYKVATAQAADSVPAQVLVAALIAAKQAINSMKAEAETAAQGDEQMMLEACETISNEGLQADIAIRAALASAQQPAPSAAVLDYPHARRFGGCPACGRSDCVAMSCTRTTSDDLLHIAARKQGGKHDNH